MRGLIVGSFLLEEKAAQEVREGVRLGRQDGSGMTDPSGGHWGLSVGSGQHLNRGEQLIQWLQQSPGSCCQSLVHLWMYKVCPKGSPKESGAYWSFEEIAD